jgi:hypothetical protein
MMFLQLDPTGLKRGFPAKTKLFLSQKVFGAIIDSTSDYHYGATYSQAN